MTTSVDTTVAEEAAVKPASPSPGKYMPGLDVVRGVAMTMVIFYHGLGVFALYAQARISPTVFRIMLPLGYGYLGVHLFFVLSGFLITGILLDTRHNANYYKPFYMRRVLRILPAYLLMIVVLKVFGEISWKFVLVSLLYLVNCSSLFHVSPEYAGFWSLSVEEQFYLVWPVLVRKLHVRKLFLLSVAIILCTPLLRLALLQGPVFIRDVQYKVWSVGDFFASGAILAMFIRSPRFRPILPKLAAVCCTLGVLLIGVAVSVPDAVSKFGIELQRSFHLVPWLVAFTGIVLVAFLNPGIAKGPIAKPMLFIGKISYGLYIVHPLVFHVIARHWHVETTSAVGMPLVGMMLLRFTVETSICVLIAFISRITFEEYFLRLKPRQPKVVENLSVA